MYKYIKRPLQKGIVKHFCRWQGEKCGGKDATVIEKALDFQVFLDFPNDYK